MLRRVGLSRRLLRVTSTVGVLAFVLIAATQNASASELALKPISLSGPVAFLRSLFASGPSVPAQGRGSGATEAGTRADHGSGSAPQPGPGQLPADAPAAGKAVVGKSGAVYKGYDAKTSKRLASRSSADSTWYQNADGSLSERRSSGPVNYKDSSGTWQPIDATLAKEADGRFHQKANGFGLSFAGGPGVSGAAESLASPGAGRRDTVTAAGSSQGELADLSLANGGSIAWSLAGATQVTPVLSADGTTTTYADVLPDTTLQLASENYGVKESIVLASPSAANSWTFPLALTGVSLAQAPSGVWNLVDATGNTVAMIALPEAFDSNIDPHTGLPPTTAVSYSLGTVNGVEQLTMTLDQTWLHDPARVFPVTVDPAVSIAGQKQSTYVDQKFPDQNYLNYSDQWQYINLGNDGAGDFDYGFLNYPSGVANTGYNISAASFTIFDQHAWNAATSYDYSVDAVYCPGTSMCWSPDTITWNNKPSAIQTTLGSGIASVNSQTCYGASGRWETTNLSTSYMDNFAARGYPFFGLQLVPNGTDDNYWKVFDSSQISSCSPYVWLTYTPDVPPQVDSMSPLDGTPVSTITPQLSATGHDSDNYPNSPVKYYFAVYSAQGGSPVADSGKDYISSSTWTVPAGKLAWGKSYQWTVDVSDGYTTETTRTYNTFVTTAPPPVLDGGLSQDSDGHGFNAALGNYTTSATDADVAGVGPALSLVRDYNSLDARTAGALGASWSSVLDAKATQVLDASGNLVEMVVTYPDGSQVVFAANSDGSFAPPAGRYATLATTKDGAGNVSGYALTDKGGTTYTFGLNAAGSTYRTPATFLITSVADRLGRAVNFTYAQQSFTLADDPVVNGVAVSALVQVPTTVTSAVTGRALHLAWFAPVGAYHPHVQTVSTDDAVAGNATTAQAWTYQYSGDQLTGVCAPSRANASVPESACTQYSYSSLSDYQEGVLDGSPFSYWPLADASGSTSAASKAAINAGTDVGTYSNVTLGGGAHLAGSTATTASFNGTTSYVTLPSSLPLSQTYFSVALWFKTTVGGGVLYSHSAAALSAGSATANYQPDLYVGSDGKLVAGVGTAGTVTSSAVVDDGSWHFAVLSVAGTGSVLTLYLDGKQAGTGTSSPDSTAETNAYLGDGFIGGGWPDEPHQGASSAVPMPFNGSLSDASFYTRALTSTEVAGLYALGTNAGSFLTKIARQSAASDPTKAPAAQVSYDSVTGRVTSVTDANGANWSLSAPSAIGTGQIYKAAVLAQAPEYYWRFGDAAGTTNPVDQINNDAWNNPAGVATYNDVTLGNGSVFAGNTSATFNGTDSQVTLPSGVLDNHANVSVSFWFKTTATNGVLFSHSQSPLSAGSTTANYQPWLYVGADGKLVGSVGVAKVAESTTAVNDGNWHHVVFAISGTTTESLYVDDKLAGTGTPSPDTASEDDIYVGAGFIGGGWPDEANQGNATATPKYFNGSISELAIFDSTLSDAQVSELWQGYKNALVSVIPMSVVTVTDPADSYGGVTHTETYDYDPLHSNRLVRYVDALGGATTYGYDTSGFLNTVTDPNGDQTITGHDVRGNVVSRTTCQYEAQNKCQTSYYSYYPDDKTQILSYPLDPRDDQQESSSDARSSSDADPTYRTSYTLDAATGLRTAVTTPPVPGFPGGRTTSTTYTDGTSAYACSGQSVVAPKGLVRQVTTPGGAVTTTSYYADGDTCQVTDADGLTTTFTYDGLGRVVTKKVVSDTYPNGLTTSYAYDGIGHVQSTTAPTVTEYVITANHNHTAVTTSAYDVDGNLTSQTVTDSSGGDAPRTVYYSYNQYDQKATSSDARSTSSTDTRYQTTYTYDAFGNVETKTDPLGRATQYLYDADNRLRTTALLNTAADGTASAGSTLILEKRTYDAGSRLASSVDGQGYTTNYLYYDDNRAYQVSKTDGSNTYINEQDTYDAAGNLTKRLTNNLVTETDSTVDAAGRMTETVVDPGGVDRSASVSYSADDQVLSATTSAAGGSAATDYTYDALGNVLSQSVEGVSSGTPAGWWRLNQTSGNTVPDASGNGNTGNAGNVTWTGSSAGFNGSSSLIASNGPVLTTTASYSISAWVNLATTSQDYQTIVGQSSADGGNMYLEYSPTFGGWSFILRKADNSTTGLSAYDYASSSTGVAAGAWTHLVAVYTASNGAMQLYVNGALAASATDTTPWQASGMTSIGGVANASGAWNYTNGQVANVQVYQRALSTSDVATLYQGGRGGGALGTTTSTTTWTRDQRGLPTSMTDADGNATHYVYDEAGRLAQTTSPTVQTTSINPQTGSVTTGTGVAVASTGYDTFGEVAESEDALGNETVNTYDAAGNRTSTSAPSYTPPGAGNSITPVTTYQYDADSELTAVFDPVANQQSSTTPTTAYTYTNLGLKHTATDVVNDTATYGYDSDGDRTSTTLTSPSDSTGVKTSAVYDYLGRMQSSTQIERYPTSASYTTQYNYADPGGWQSSATLPSGKTPASYTYDNVGEKTQVTDANSDTTSYSYDFAGRLAKTTLPDLTYSTAAYDALGDPTSTTNYDKTGALLSSVSAVYDGAGRKTSSTDALGNTTTYLYDPTGLLTSETQPACVVSTQTPTCAYTSITVGYGYDLDGHRTAYADGNGNGSVTDTGHTTYTTYNSRGLPESTIEPAASASTYTALSDRTTTDAYDPDGRLSSQTAPGGVSTTYTYNPTGTLATESGSGAVAATATRTFGYDALGDVTSASTSNTSTTSTSNATSESFSYDDRGNLLTVGGSAGSSSFTYTPDGQMATRQDAAGTTSYNYDNQDRLQTLADPLTGITATYTYTPQSQVNTITYGTGGDVRSYTYDSQHRVTADTLTSGATTVKALGYGYDADGHLTSKTDANGAANTYTYDLAGRLTSWNNGTSTTAYAYDQDSNRVRVGANVYTYDQRDELTSDGTNTYTYSARGTMTAKTVTSTGTTALAYTADAFNQQITAGAGTYLYDASGRLLSRTTTSTKSFQYSGVGSSTIAYDGGEKYSYDPSGGAFAVYFVGTSTGRLLATDLHTDVVGDFAPTSTAMDGVQTYDPLGKTLVRTGTMTTVSLGYQSQYFDSTTGQTDMGARWYNPATGQFTSKDSQTNSAVPNTAAANPFGYANANPLINTDPDGHHVAADAGTCSGGQYFNEATNTCFTPTNGSGGGASYGNAGGTSNAASDQNSPTTVVKINQASAHPQMTHPQDAAAPGNCGGSIWDEMTDVHSSCFAKIVTGGAVSWVASMADGFTYDGKYMDGWTFSGEWDGWMADHWGIGQGSQSGRAVHDVANFLDIASLAFGGAGAARDAAALPKGAGALPRVRAFLGSLLGIRGSGDDAAAASAVGDASRAGDNLTDERALDRLKQANNKSSASSAPTTDKPPTQPAPHSAAPTTTAKPPASVVSERLTVEAVKPIPAEATTAITAAPEATEVVAEETASAAARPEASVDDSSLPSCATHSFTGSTPVLMANGATKPIDQIKAGDRIANGVPGQNDTQTHTVTKVIVTKTDHDFVNLTVEALTTTSPSKASTTALTAKKTIAAAVAAVAMTAGAGTAQAPTVTAQHGGTITTTFHHPFYDITQAAFVDAQNLQPGDELQTPTGDTVITSVRLYHANTVTYDLTIGDLHTYYVVAGSTPVLVHNVDEERLCDLTLGPGPNARQGVALVNGDIREPGVQELVNESGDNFGCHTCDARVPGTSPQPGRPQGNWITDHQGPTKLLGSAPFDTFQTGYPHCWVCARQQAGIVTQLNRGNYSFDPESAIEPESGP